MFYVVFSVKLLPVVYNHCKKFSFMYSLIFLNFALVFINTLNSIFKDNFFSEKSPNHSIVEELNPRENDSNISSKVESSVKNLLDDRVQIVTVSSNVYNTPPRKTFPENVQRMSLAEQIDYKMKEVMLRFEHETQYGESSTDSGSEENPAAKFISRIKNSPSVKLNFETDNEIKSPESSIQELSGLSKKPRSSLVKHITADSNFGMSSSDESPPIKTRQIIVRHVTADCETVFKPVKLKQELKKSVIPECELEKTSSESSCSSFSQHVKETMNSKNFKCGFCVSHTDPYCFVCRKSVSHKGTLIRQKCSLYQCARYYHPECLKLWPQTQWSFIQTTKHKISKEEIDAFVCPQHFCHTCSSDDPRAATSRCSGDKIVKCLKCPASYHSTNFCIPAGKLVLTIKSLYLLVMYSCDFSSVPKFLN